MKIFLTGAAGFIGFFLTKKLISEGHVVVGIDNFNDYYDVNLKKKRISLIDSKNFTFLHKDLNNLDSINEKSEFDLAINLAAQAGVRVTSDTEDRYKLSNIEGFKSFCDFCLDKKINKIIYASSSSVYDDKNLTKFSEEFTSTKPKSLYGKTKLFNEEYATQFSKKNNLKFLGLRFFSVYGPYGRPDMAYYKFSVSLNNESDIYLNDNGNMHRDMTYIDDVIDGIMQSITFLFSKQESSHEIFNLGNNNPIKTSYMLKRLEYLFNKKAKLINVVSKNESKYTHADLSKSRSLLGYNPKIKFDEGINKFVDWFKKNQID